MVTGYVFLIRVGKVWMSPEARGSSIHAQVLDYVTILECAQEYAQVIL